MVPSEGEWLEDANVEFLLQLESAYSKNFELPFLKGSHQLGVVESNMYETCMSSSRLGGRGGGAPGGPKLNRGFPRHRADTTILWPWGPRT